MNYNFEGIYLLLRRGILKIPYTPLEKIEIFIFENDKIVMIIMCALHISISGIFNKKTIDRKLNIGYREGMTVADIMSAINQTLGISIGSSCIKNNEIVMVCADKVIQTENLSEKISDEISISIIQPFAGG
jgi:molybdopterin converting factor small subunit